ncbi:MAG: 1,4-alpha-glucan branching protein domain-containing protein [Planctomycetota bacterium]
MNDNQGRFALVLHSHIPFVLRHGRWPHGTDWLCEAAAESYLPILASLERLHRDKIPSRLTLTMSPILCEQLADPDFKNEFSEWLRVKGEQVRADSRRPELSHVAATWLAWLSETQNRFDTIEGNIVSAFRKYEELGMIEIGTCAATHGYLPLLSRDESVSLQLRVAVETHEKHFGKKPRGIWLPECAYRPRYEWTPPIGRDAGKYRWMRQGIEESVAKLGIQYFFVDAHLVHAGDPLSIYRNFYSSLASLRGYEERFPQSPKTRSPLATYQVKSRGATATATAFIREPRTSLQIWSRDEGYPGDGFYLDFHKRNVANGMRYYRVTGPGAADANKAVYEPEVAAARAEEHARHFVWLIGETLRSRSESGELDGIVCSPFDTELFGHWWFEGPLFIEHVFRHLAETDIVAVAASDELNNTATRETVQLMEGSWGEGGDHRAWLNNDTEWTWNRLYDAEADIADAAKIWKSKISAASPATLTILQRAMKQALRELLLLQSSDWQFAITTRSARDYAERRFATHYVELKRLADIVRRGLNTEITDPEDLAYLEAMERRDRAFQNMDIDSFINNSSL